MRSFTTSLFICKYMFFNNKNKKKNGFFYPDFCKKVESVTISLDCMFINIIL